MAGRWFVVLASVAVLAAIAAALLLVGGPRTARLERLDERRIADLQALATRVGDHLRLEGRLPADLAELDRALPGDSPASDPATAEPYLYEPLDARRFRVCARLARPDGDGAERDHWPRRPRPDMALVAATGRDGRFCFETVPTSGAD